MQQDASNSSNRTQLSDLPVALLAQTLQHVPLPHRLGSAALVSTDWAKAATQSVRQLQLKLTYTTARGLEAWLQQHGRQLESLDLQHSDMHSQLRLQLPWASLAGLQRLILNRVKLPALASTAASQAQAGNSASASSSSSSTAVTLLLLPQLKHLELVGSSLGSIDCLPRLASPCLTHLVVIYHLRLSPSSDQQQQQQPVSPARSRLPNLRVLHLHPVLSSDILQRMAAMQQLQDLDLCLGQGAFVDCFTSLPSSLTRLRLVDDRPTAIRNAAGSANPTLPPQLSQLSRLQHLELISCRMLPAVLASMTALRQLDLSACFLLPLGPQGQPQPAAIGALLSAVQCLTQLQFLRLDNVALATEGIPPQHYAALTASTQLTELTLTSRQPLPPGAAQHVFPAGRQLPHLQWLVVMGSCDEYWGVQHVQPCLDGQDLARIARCCPGLEGLTVIGVLHNATDLTPLVQLLPHSCSSLSVGGATVDDAAAPILAQLTQLTDLGWGWSPRLTDTGLEQVTALRGLQQLDVNCCNGLSAVVAEDSNCQPNDYGAFQQLALSADEDQGPVWQQLRALCDKSPVCQARQAASRSVSLSASSPSVSWWSAAACARWASAGWQVAQVLVALAQRLGVAAATWCRAVLS